MGHRYAPSYANVYMSIWEEEALQKFPLKPLFYYRFLDDIIGIWEHGQDKFQQFIQTLNNHHDSINLKYEFNHDQINFLDTTIFTQSINSTSKKLLTKGRKCLNSSAVPTLFSFSIDEGGRVSITDESNVILLEDTSEQAYVGPDVMHDDIALTVNLPDSAVSDYSSQQNLVCNGLQISTINKGGHEVISSTYDPYLCGEVSTCYFMGFHPKHPYTKSHKKNKVMVDTETASVCLWREAAIQAIKIDDLVLITHLKTKESERGWCLQSTAFTKVEKREVTHKGVTVIGVLPGTTSNSNSNSEQDLQLLLEDGR
ncbi:uncharacterized protein V6R79_013742 [Siganus canaliculatus]